MKSLVLLILASILVSCGSSSPTFTAVWSGTFEDLDDNCPFALNANVDALFPLTVNEAADGTFTIIAADGTTAVGGQGDGEEISFSANAPYFGDYGSILPYVCTATARVAFLSVGETKSEIAIVQMFNDCVVPTSTQVTDCFATYYYTGEKL